MIHLKQFTSLMVVTFFLIDTTFAQVKDKDKNLYNEIKIGNQTWLNKNLMTSRFQDGSSIPEARTDEEWIKAGDEGKPAWCYYNNDPKNDKIFGKLYNWYAVNDPRGIAPKSYNVATLDDWNTLLSYAGAADSVGIYLKSHNFDTEWNRPGTSSGPYKYETPSKANSTGFGAAGGGGRSKRIQITGTTFKGLLFDGFFWTKTEKDDKTAYVVTFQNEKEKVGTNANGKYHGYSVRCIKK